MERRGVPAKREPLRGFVRREREMADMTASRSSSESTLPGSKSSARGALASIAAPVIHHVSMSYDMVEGRYDLRCCLA